MDAGTFQGSALLTTGNGVTTSVKPGMGPYWAGLALFAGSLLCFPFSLPSIIASTTVALYWLMIYGYFRREDASLIAPMGLTYVFFGIYHVLSSHRS